MTSGVTVAEYKRTIFLINPKFQIRFSLIICSLVYLSSLIYPFTIIELFNSFARVSPDAAVALDGARQELITFLLVYQFIFAGIVFVLCVFLSHKIAGPMYKLSTYLRNIAQGAAPSHLSFRGGDNFQELADDVNSAFDALADSQEENYAYLTEVMSYLNNLALVIPEDKKPVLKEINDRLKDIQGRLRQDS